jgi:hypothetical protein
MMNISDFSADLCTNRWWVAAGIDRGKHPQLEGIIHTATIAVAETGTKPKGICAKYRPQA